MDLGVIIGDVPTTVTPRQHLDHLLAQVDAAQRAGVRYITIGQHYLYGDHRWLQPIPTLARLAAEVSADTRLVTTVVLLPLYHPVALAEDLATLDILSAGRLIVGVGLGYRTVEYRNLGVPFGERVARFEEGLSLVKRLWTEPHVEHHGRFFDVDGSPHLQPWQQPHPPVWVGAQTEAGVRRSARLGERWPIGPNATPDDVERLLGVYVEERRRIGLPVGLQPIRRDVAFGTSRPDAFDGFLDRAKVRFEAYAANEHRAIETRGSVEESLRAQLVYGTVDDCIEDVTALAARLPVDPLIVRPHWPGMSSDEVVAYIDRVGDLADGLRPVRPVDPATIAMAS